MWYDTDGKPISMVEAAEFFDGARRDERRIALDEFDGWTVSTVHLVTNHAFDGGPPLIFETMVFPPQDVEWPHGLDEYECVRTPTKEAALAMHDQVLCELRNALARNCL